MSLVFFHLCKALFVGFLQVKGKFVDGQNTSKVRDEAPLISKGDDTSFTYSKWTLIRGSRRAPIPLNGSPMEKLVP